VYWPQAHLQRAATAIRDARSNDTVVIAKRCLEAAIRNETDLVALLDPEHFWPRPSGDPRKKSA
jgi:hypothetical protein